MSIEFIALRAIFRSKRYQVHKIHLNPIFINTVIHLPVEPEPLFCGLHCFFKLQQGDLSLFALILFCIFCYAHLTMLRINSGFFCLILPTAIVSIRISTVLHRIIIFSFPRMVWFSNPRETSNRLFTLCFYFVI